MEIKGRGKGERDAGRGKGKRKGGGKGEKEKGMWELCIPALPESVVQCAIVLAIRITVSEPRRTGILVCGKHGRYEHALCIFRHAYNAERNNTERGGGGG
jgi:hypothetical protein